MTDPNAHDTLPAMHPDTPPWAESHYNLMVKVYHKFTAYERHRDGEILKLQARVSTLEDKVARLERRDTMPSPPLEEEDTNPGRRQ